MTFEQAIKKYLDQRAAEDPQFAQSYAKESKSIEECVRYIWGEVAHEAKKSKSERVAISDAEIFGMTVHYYDEDGIKIRPVTGVRGAVTATSSKSDRNTSKSASKKKDKKSIDEAPKARQNASKRTKPRSEEEMFVGTLFDMSLFGE